MEHTDHSTRLPRTPKELRAFLNYGTDVARIEYFSDAVFAIAITLLALEIRLPELRHHASDADILAALGSLGRILFSFVFSFVLIGVQWVRHHALFRLIRKHDPKLVALNLFGLMMVTLVPLPTVLYGNQISSTVAIAVFYGFHATASAVWAILWIYASSGNRLIAPELSRDMVHYVTLMQCVPPLAMLGGLIAVLIGGPQVAAIGLVAALLLVKLLMARVERSLKTPTGE